MVMQGVDCCDQRLFILRPARSIGGSEHRGADLLIGQVRRACKNRDMDAPFVFAACQRTSAIDDDLPLPERQRAPIQQAAITKFLVSRARWSRRVRNSTSGGTPGGMIASNWL